jgi:hemolysin D
MSDAVTADLEGTAAAEAPPPRLAPAPRHPARELLARYAAVLRAAWQARHELTGPRRLADQAAFLPAALSLQETPVHPAPRRLAYALMALFTLALTWSILGQVDIVAVAQGRLIVSERTKTIQPLERSVVKRVLVRDGEQVQAGQPLIELDPTAASADKASIGEQLKASTSEAARARALLRALQGGSEGRANPVLEAEPEWTTTDRQSAQAQLAAEWSDITAKLAKLAAEIQRRQAEVATAREAVAKLEATLPLAQRREQDFRRLADQGFMSSHAGQDRERERIEIERDLATQRAKLAEMQAGLRESENARTAFLAETRRTLYDREAQAELRRQGAVQEKTKAAHREQLTVLTAPVDGVVQQLAVHTVGGVVTEAQVLMVVVPQTAQVLVEVALENKDIGFVVPGQAASVKFETFNFTRYGTVDATVVRVTADAVQDEKRGAIFPVTLALAKDRMDVDGKTVRLSPGLNLTAEIKTGRRRLIDYLMSPVQRATREAVRER